MIHKDNIEKYDGSLKQLAEDLGNLKYDALADFLHLLADKINQDSLTDKANGRKKLAIHLFGCGRKLKDAALDIDKAWDICKRYMDEHQG